MANSMNTENYKQIKKLSFVVTILLMLCVAGIGGIFAYYKVTYMVYHSIPTFIMYIIFLIMIYKDKLIVFFWSLYVTFAIYMSAATICLGINFGFNLYCMSLIPIGYFTEYLSHRIDSVNKRTGLASIGLIIVFILTTAYASVKGPVYVVDQGASHVFYITNALLVLAFLVFYTKLIIGMVVSSEKKLEYMAHNDNLTGLWNRHFLMAHIREMREEGKLYWIAILDIDNFKSVNDIYGHNLGDTVLIQVADIMKETCKDCYVARWGGEEFLMVPKNSNVSTDIVDTLRKNIEGHLIEMEGKCINVTISGGVTDFISGERLEKCIQRADDNLYTSKRNGRNQVTKT